MTEELWAAGIDPDCTPVDHFPEHAAWALVREFNEQNGIDSNE